MDLEGKMLKKFKLTWATGLVMSLILGFSACAPKAPPSGGVTDQLGRSVKLKNYPQRIVSLAPSNTEILFALGLGDKVVGVTTFDDFPEEAKSKEKVGGLTNPDIEKLVSLRPDLVVATSLQQGMVIPQLERQNITVIALSPKNVPEILEGITLLGKVTGADNEAKKLVNSMQARINKVSKLTSQLTPEERPRVFYLLWSDPLLAAGKNTFHDELIRLAGGVNIFSDVEKYGGVNLEVVLDRNPQIILADTGHGSGGDTSFRWAAEESRLKGTEALKEDQVFEIDADLVNRAGPRIVDGLEAMLKLIHPDLYEQL